MFLDASVLQLFSLLLKTGDFKQLSWNNKEGWFTTGCSSYAQQFRVQALTAGIVTA